MKDNVASDESDIARFAAVGKEAAVIAHDLSQPMNIIRMTAEAALLVGPKDDAVRAAFELIVAQADLMSDTLDRMRVLSIPGAQQTPLPLHAPRLDEQATAVESATPTGHILVVDDEPSATRILFDYLGSMGYRVTTAFDGEDAFAKFLDDPPDIVISDMRMPRCDGMTLMARIHESIPNFPVVLLTGETEREGRKDDRETTTSPAATLTKPVSLKAVADLIGRLLTVTER